MLPYLTGERAPHWSSLPRGVLFGLQRRHGRAHIVRAALEGVMYQLHAVLRLLEDSGVEPHEIRATGGFAASRLWRQIMADVFDRPISVALRFEGSAFGAALLGMQALGLVDSLEAADEFVQMGEVHEPIPEHADVHRELQPIFERLYSDLLPEFRALADLQQRLPMEHGTADE
jgi:gluconokinase